MKTGTGKEYCHVSRNLCVCLLKNGDRRHFQERKLILSSGHCRNIYKSLCLTFCHEVQKKTRLLFLKLLPLKICYGPLGNVLLPGWNEMHGLLSDISHIFRFYSFSWRKIWCLTGDEPEKAVLTTKTAVSLRLWWACSETYGSHYLTRVLLIWVFLLCIQIIWSYSNPQYTVMSILGQV